MSTQIIQLDAQDLREIVADEVSKVLEQRSASDQGFLRMRDAAAYLGISENALRMASKRDEIPLHRLGKRVLFDRSELGAFVRNGVA